MKKGIWAINLVARIVKRSISLSDGLAFGFARIRKKPVSLFINGLEFNEVDHILWSALADVYLNRVYLPPMFDIHLDDVVVDLGAHRGAFTSFAVGLTANTVVAVEPNPENFAFLNRVIERNGLRNVVLINAAVGGKSGRSKMYVSSFSSRHSLTKNETSAGEIIDEIEVDVISLDECLASLEVVHLLKMDCEGAEFDILLNAQSQTLNKIQKLAMETHDAFDSPEMKALCDRIRLYLPRLKIVDQKKGNLGYLYAWKSDL